MFYKLKRSDKVIEKWTGALIGKMHNNGIKQVELAEKLGITNSYTGMILRGERKPPNIRQRMESAVEELIKEREKKDV
jgi:transcriptional regulator with XRE-family HTH domain